MALKGVKPQRNQGELKETMFWNRQQWAKTFIGNHKLILLEEQGEIFLFKSQRWSLIKHDYYGDKPTYTVWHGNEIVYCGGNYKEAHDKFETEKQDCKKP